MPKNSNDKSIVIENLKESVNVVWAYMQNYIIGNGNQSLTDIDKMLLGELKGLLKSAGNFATELILSSDDNRGQKKVADKINRRIREDADKLEREEEKPAEEKEEEKQEENPEEEKKEEEKKEEEKKEEEKKEEEKKEEEKKQEEKKEEEKKEEKPEEEKKEEEKKEEEKKEEEKKEEEKKEEKPEEEKKEEEKNDEEKPEEIKNEEVKNEEVKNEEIKNEEVKNEEVKNEEVKNEEEPAHEEEQVQNNEEPEVKPEENQPQQDNNVENPEQVNNAEEPHVDVEQPIPMEIHNDEMYQNAVFEKVDGRSTAPAASEFSDLVGQLALVNHAEKSKTVVNGQEINGIVRTKIYGERVGDENFKKGLGKDTFNNPQMFSNIAALSALDYIFGTEGRKAQDVAFHFDEGEEKKMVGLVAINKGINTEKNADEADLGSITVIGEDLADSILFLTKDMVCYTLHNSDLTQDEMDVLWNKVEKLQNAIKAGKEHYKDRPEGELDNGFIRVVPEDSFGAYNLDQLAKGSNFFQALKEVSEPAAELENQNEAVNPTLVFQNKITSPDTIRVVMHNSRENMANVDGANSIRYALSFKNTDGVDVQGFFTPSKLLGRQNNYRKIAAKYANDPAILSENPKIADFFSRYEDYVRQTNFKDSALYFRKFGELGYTQDEVAALKADPKFAELVKKASNEMTDKYNTNNTLVDFYGALAGSEMDVRNTAMSNVAELYGVPDLLAKSVPMEMEIDGNIVRGTFMERADGIDLSHILPGDPMTTYGKEVYDNSPGLKSMADLQIIDYICLNADRHDANMMYHFSNDNPPKFLGVTGFDNDTSFGTKDWGEDVFGLGSLKGINVITESMAEHIKNVTEEEHMKAVQIKGLSKEEAEASWKRVCTLKERVESGRIRTVKDDEWEKTTLDELCVPAPGDKDNVNIFTNLKRTIDNINSTAEMHQGTHHLISDDAFIKTDRVEEFNDETFLKSLVEEQEKVETQALADEMEAGINSESNEEKEILTDAQLVARLKTESAQMLKTISEGEHWYKSKPAEYKAVMDQIETFHDKVEKLDNNIKKGKELKNNEVSDLMKDLSEITAKSSDALYMLWEKPEPDHDDLRRIAAVKDTRETGIKFYEGFAKNAHKREMTANPVIKAYDLLKEESAIAAKWNPENQTEKEALKYSLARMIYYKAITRNAQKLRANKGINVATKQEVVERNVDKIMKSRTFKEMTNSDDKLRSLKSKAAEPGGNGVYKAFVKTAASQAGAEKLNALKQAKQAQMQNQNNGPIM